MITTAELVKKVRRLVNEAESDADVSVVTADYRSLDDCIVALLPQAVSLVQKMKNSTTEAVNVKILSPAVIGITDNGDGTGSMPLPNDYVGPVVVQLEGWRRPARFVDISSSEAARQCNEYTRAGCCKPVCIESVNAVGERVLLLCPLPAAPAKVKSFIYEACFAAGDVSLNSSTPMANAVAYECAALLYNMFERYDAANSFMSLAAALCNAKSNERR